MRSLAEIPNFVVVGARATMACGKMYDSSNAMTFVEAFTNEDMLELESFGNKSTVKNQECLICWKDAPLGLIINTLALI